MKILIISDSHLKNDWTTLIGDYDVIIHAGDHQMSQEWIITHTDYYVDGNNDWGSQFQQTFTLEKLKFLLVHGDEQHVKSKNGVSEELKTLALQQQADIVIFGHTHVPLIEKIDNITFINPGSISKPRLLQGQKTYAILDIHEGQIRQLEIKNF